MSVTPAAKSAGISTRSKNTPRRCSVTWPSAAASPLALQKASAAATDAKSPLPSLRQLPGSAPPPPLAPPPARAAAPALTWFAGADAALGLGLGRAAANASPRSRMAAARAAS